MCHTAQPHQDAQYANYNRNSDVSNRYVSEDTIIPQSTYLSPVFPRHFRDLPQIPFRFPSLYQSWINLSRFVHEEEHWVKLLIVATYLGTNSSPSGPVICWNRRVHWIKLELGITNSITLHRLIVFDNSQIFIFNSAFIS
uniref:Uncharacterized protein n=1 Tax=Bionectria ochroleuca TaxID=29856 RepID=A0A0B7K245_BIOOC